VKRLRLPRSLRAQLAAGAALLALTVIGLAGAFIALRLNAEDLAQVDQGLRAQEVKVSADAAKITTDPGYYDKADGGEARSGESGLLAGSQSIVRVLSGGTVVSQHGDTPPAPVPLPPAPGFSTLSLGGQQWRSLVTPVAGNGQVQVITSLAPVQQRLEDSERTVAAATTAATVLAGAGVWLLGGLILVPLQRLRAEASQIRSGHDLGRRLPAARAPREVTELADTLNDMLDSLQASTAAARRFTADAAHELRTPLTALGIDLEGLQRNPDLPPGQRAAMLTAMTAEHQRITRLLDGLVTLARGDARALPASTSTDLAELAADGADRAAAAHPQAHIEFRDTLPGPAVLDGWADGLRMAIRNLLDNAAVHGSPDGTVTITISRADSNSVLLTVDDDGPGIPPEAREQMLQRFARGASPGSAGSGLGLAIASQQATLHGGTLTLTQSPAGGLRAAMQLPAPAAGAASCGP
jgi:two-component system sensor histidine kinase PrrB